MDELIAYMKTIGWYEDGECLIKHKNIEEAEYKDWTEAIYACIEIASGV